MDLLTTRAIDITKFALDGLMARQQAITANTANVMTPNYQRKEVDFEGQLKAMVERDELKQYIKTQNCLQYNPTSIETASVFDRQPRTLTSQEAKYLQSNTYGDFAPQVIDDTTVGDSESGNNVDLEKEIMDMAKVGTQYTLLANLEQRSLKEISDIIKG